MLKIQGILPNDMNTHDEHVFNFQIKIHFDIHNV